MEGRLLYAARLRDVEEVKRLIDQGVSVNCTDSNGWSPLHFASSIHGHSDVVQVLLQHGCNPKLISKGGWSSLHLASVKGHGDVVQLLLQHGSNPNLQKHDGWSPLHLASENRHSDVVQLLLQHGSNPNLQEHFGRSPLHLASRKGHSDGHSDVVQLLLQHGSNPNLQEHDGSSPLHKASDNEHVQLLLQHGGNPNLQQNDLQTPLHLACENYDPSEQRRIDTCVTLIEAGGDYQMKDKDGNTPVDMLRGRGYSLDDAEARPVKKAIERRDYSLLLTESVPFTVVKIFLVGDPAAGKTTIKRAITTNTRQEQPHIPTPGIDVGTYDIDGIGKVSLWDAAGQVEFHATHGLFLGSENSVATVVYNLRESNAYERLQYWLQFLKSGKRASAKTKLKIVIVATHLDEFVDKDRGFKLAQKNLTEIISFFGTTLDISSEVHLINSREAQSDEMDMFKATLRDTTTNIKGSRKLPKLCEAILEHKSSWIQPTHPVLSYPDYIERVKEVDPLVSPKLVRVTANYLQDMGEIFLAQSSDTITHVVLDTKWLTYHIIGPTLAGDLFVDQFNLLPPKTKYNKEELERFYSGVADFSTLSQLLESLEIMITFDGISFIIPTKIPRENVSSKSEFRNRKGRSIFTADCRSIMSPSVFPIIQIRIMKLLGSESNQPTVTRHSLTFAHQTVALVKELNGRYAINFAVEYTDGNAELSFDDLEKMTNIIVTAMYELSPGTSIKTGYPSSQSLLQSSYLKTDDYYTMDEIELGEDHDGTVYHKSLKIREKTTDILIAGGDPYFLRKKGFNCDYQWMLQKHRNKLFEILDARNDHRKLAEILHIDDGDLAAIEKSCMETKESFAESVLSHWRETTGERMSLERLHGMLKDPGKIGSSDAAKVIEDMMKEMGHQVPSEAFELDERVETTMEIGATTQQPSTSDLVGAFQNININDQSLVVSCQVDQSGTELCIPNTGVSLKIPDGAIPVDRSINVVVSLLLNEDDYPPLDRNHTLITPVVRCESEGFKFLKPAELSLPSDGVRLRDVDLTLWKKSEMTGLWMKAPHTLDSSQPSRQAISVAEESTNIKISMWHFCKHAVSANTNKIIKILVYQNPASLDQSGFAYVSVYAIPSSILRPVIEDVQSEQHPKGVEISLRNDFILYPNERDLQITLRDIKPQPGWDPMAAEGKMQYEKLACETAVAYKQFKFTKTSSAPGVTTIEGELVLLQEDGLTDNFFFNTILKPKGSAVPISKPQLPSSDTRTNTSSEGGAVPKRKLRPSSDKSTKRSRKDSISEDKLSNKDIIDVATKASLTRDQLKFLYFDLGVSFDEIQNAERCADTHDFKLQACEVLRHWRTKHGGKATRRAIIESLENCGWNEAKQVLKEKWNVP